METETRYEMPSNSIYADQAINEAEELKLFFGIAWDIFGGSSNDAEKLKKLNRLLAEFELTFDCWSDLAISVMVEAKRNQ